MLQILPQSVSVCETGVFAPGAAIYKPKEFLDIRFTFHSLAQEYNSCLFRQCAVVQCANKSILVLANTNISNTKNCAVFLWLVLNVEEARVNCIWNYPGLLRERSYGVTSVLRDAHHAIRTRNCQALKSRCQPG